MSAHEKLSLTAAAAARATALETALWVRPLSAAPRASSLAACYAAGVSVGCIAGSSR